MKRKIFYSIITVIAMAFILVLCSNKVEASTKYNNQISYNENYDGTISIEAAGPYITVVNTIPSTINGKPVTKIGYAGFENCADLKTVVIPSTIKEIDEYAFKNCSSLAQINIPNTITTLKRDAFYGCSSLTSISIPTVTVIERGAFYGCTRLRSITISKNLKEIGAYAFEKCISLTSIALPNTLNFIGYGAFLDCSSLASITVPASVTEFQSGWSESGTFEGCTSLKTANIKASAKVIRDRMFKNCTSLTSVALSNTVEELEDQIFSGCTSLKNVTLPNNITTMGREAFYGCTNLTTVTLPEKLTKIEANCFYDCLNLTTVNIKDKVEEIRYGAFYNCKKLESIKIPQGVKNLTDGWSEKGVFENCTALRNVYFTTSIQGIVEDAFDNVPASQVTIYGYEGTAAKSYAQSKGFRYIPCTPVSSIKITGSNRVVKGKKITLKATVSPSNAFNKKVKWTISDPYYATVNQSGVVTGNRGGTVTVAATSTDGTVIKTRYTITVSLTELPFKDVNMNNWFYNSVKFVYNHKYVTGTTATTFKPNDKLTRGQLVTILWRMAGSPKTNGGKKFSDVNSKDYYYNAVRWASANKVVSGTSATKFSPTKYITREQLAVMLQNYARYKNKNTTKTTNISKFRDSSGVASYAKSAVKWAVANKIISGKENGTKIAPRGNATRAEIAAMIQNYCNYVK